MSEERVDQSPINGFSLLYENNNNKFNDVVTLFLGVTSWCGTPISNHELSDSAYN